MSKAANISLVGLLTVIGGVHAGTVQGKVTNQSGRALAKAVVTLVTQGLKDTTGTDGMYSISTGNTSVLPSMSPLANPLALRNGILEISLNRSVPVSVEILDTRGARVESNDMQILSSGAYRLDVARMAKGTGICLVRVVVDGRATSFRFARMGGAGAASSDAFRSYSSDVLARVAAVTDSLRVSASGYTTKSVALASLDGTVNVTLDTILPPGTGYALKNSPVPTAGCGKSTVKSGTYKIMNRDYTVDIPANYNASKPSRMIFGMHCMGSSRAGVVNDQYYQLKPLDTEKNTIFVALQGESDGTWQKGADDHKFFEEVHKYLTGNLCVDSSRVFSVGFSFGAMFTNSLSRNHQGILRAVTTYAPADYNIYLPPVTIDAPIGAMITVGLGDERCPPSTARSCRDLKVKHNKCTVPATVSETTKGSGAHVCYDYQGCTNYPVKFCTFDGGHDDRPKDRNTNSTWIHSATWSFLNQF